MQLSGHLERTFKCHSLTIPKDSLLGHMARLTPEKIGWSKNQQ